MRKDKRRNLPKPTASELEILGVLWRLGPATVRQVHEVLDARRPAGYTTTLKLMQIMTEKGLLEREGQGRAHVYHPVLAREETQGRLVDDLLDKVFGGSSAELVMRALSRRKASRAELAAIKALIEDHERAGR